MPQQHVQQATTVKVVVQPVSCVLKAIRVQVYIRIPSSSALRATMQQEGPYPAPSALQDNSVHCKTLLGLHVPVAITALQVRPHALLVQLDTSVQQQIQGQSSVRLEHTVQKKLPLAPNVILGIFAPRVVSKKTHLHQFAPSVITVME